MSKRQPQELPYLTRAATGLGAVSVDREKRLVTFSFSSERPVERYAYGGMLPEGASSLFDEICPSEAKYWNLERVKEGVCCLIENHNLGKIYGIVRSVEFRDGLVIGTTELEETPESDRYMKAIEKNLAGGVSYGYRPEKYTVISKAEYAKPTGDEDYCYLPKLIKKAVLRAENITLYEISARVTVPADPTVGRGLDLRSVAIDGDPGWETEILERANPEDLKVGDRVTWTSSGGDAAGAITQKAMSGTIVPKPKGKPMSCSDDNPGFLVQVYRGDNPTEVYTAHRAESLTKVSAKSEVGEPLERVADASQWFPLAYAKSLKADYPDIWNKGGNIRGNDAYELALKYKSGDRSDDVVKWHDVERPAWIARHYPDHLLAGVVAQIKWLTVGELGVDGMKKLIDEAKDKSKKGNEMTTEEQLEAALARIAELEGDSRSLTETRSEAETLRSQVEILTTEVQTREEAFTTLNNQVQLMQRTESVGAQYNELRRKAESLRSESKLSAHEFDKLFKDEPKGAIALYVKSETGDRDLEKLAFFLEMTSDRAPQLNLKSALKDEPLAASSTQLSEADIQLQSEQMLEAVSNQRVVL